MDQCKSNSSTSDAAKTECQAANEIYKTDKADCEADKATCIPVRDKCLADLDQCKSSNTEIGGIKTRCGFNLDQCKSNSAAAEAAGEVCKGEKEACEEALKKCNMVVEFLQANLTECLDGQKRGICNHLWGMGHLYDLFNPTYPYCLGNPGEPSALHVSACSWTKGGYGQFFQIDKDRQGRVTDQNGKLSINCVQSTVEPCNPLAHDQELDVKPVRGVQTY